ncbi:hypothetical protein [Tsukamurella hominis]|uniref:DUF7341 domain-containing protein n=1 Tax=Tsukamurella hominis TaxID=1970232 RepID=UPI0039EAC645
MTAPHEIPEQEFRQRLHQFRDAIHDLIGARFQNFTLDDGTNRIHEQDCRYQQLRAHLAGQQGSGNGNTHRSLPAVWADAVDVLRDIDTTVTAWQPDPGPFDGDLTHAPTPEAVRRLRLLEARPWAPANTTDLTVAARALERWAKQIDDLLDPPPRIDLAAPCPACGESIAYRRDSAGETVRSAALQVSSDGCTCLCCHYTWTPDYFTHLARTIGCALPAGVLE